MPAPRASSKLWLATLIIAAVILYGSFYPFEFRVPASGIGPIATFLASIGQRPGRGDFIANILLYLPFGFFFVLSHGSDRQAACLPVVVLGGALLSLSVELTQYYDAGRVTAFSDFYTNTLGTLLGGLAALPIGASFRLPYIGEVTARPIPTLLIIAWLGYRMYPYVPTIDLHKYWNALKPIVLTPSLTSYDLFHQATIWLALYALIEAAAGRRRSGFLAPMFAILVLCGKILIVNTVLRLAEPVGAATAFVVWLALLWLPVRLQAGIVGLVVVRLRDRAAARAVHLPAVRPQLRLGPVRRPDAWFASGRCAGVPGEVLPVWQHGLSARHRAAAAGFGDAAGDAAAVRDELGGDLSARPFGRGHRRAHGAADCRAVRHAADRA